MTWISLNKDTDKAMSEGDINRICHNRQGQADQPSHTPLLRLHNRNLNLEHIKVAKNNSKTRISNNQYWSI